MNKNNYQLICGSAGTGKTFLINEKVTANPNFGVLCSTSGVSAINIGATTVNSLLKYFDLDSLREAFASGRLLKRLAELAESYRYLIVDEVSMLSADALDILYKAAKIVGIGIILVGDFAQLPPIKERWAFEADCWLEFERNTTKLVINWRQTDANFLSALDAIRHGDGASGLANLQAANVALNSEAKIGGAGITTILARNQDVDRFNFAGYQFLDRRVSEICSRSRRWGEQRAEWNPKKGLIPEELRLRVGAYVMILANDAPKFTYVNGDCGYVRDYNSITNRFTIELIRNGQSIEIGQIDRLYQTRDEPTLPGGFEPVHTYCQCDGDTVFAGEGRKNQSRRILAPWGVPSFNCTQGTWNIGAVRYHPLRLAYAATVHKTQGLSLDRIQVDFRNFFFAQPSMMYTALSRCRTPEGLRLVGSSDQFIKRVNVDDAIRKWL